MEVAEIHFEVGALGDGGDDGALRRANAYQGERKFSLFVAERETAENDRRCRSSRSFDAKSRLIAHLTHLFADEAA